MPNTKKFQLSHKSPVRRITIFKGDTEGNQGLALRDDALQENIRKQYPGAEFVKAFAGDITDKGTSPIAATHWAADQDVCLGGNRDFNLLAMMYALKEKDYIDFVYNTTSAIQQNNQGQYAHYYDANRKLKAEGAWLAQVEAGNAPKYTFKGSNFEAGINNWLLPNSPLFSKFANDQCGLFDARYEDLSDSNKKILYLRYAHQYTRGAPDAFMLYAIDLAAKTAAEKGRPFNKDAANKAYKELSLPESEGYADRYAALRKQLNDALGLKEHSVDNGEGLNVARAASPLVCEGSFEEIVLEKTMHLELIKDYIKKSEIAYIIGDDKAKNKVVVFHGGIQHATDLSLPDGKAPAKSIKEYIERYGKIRDEFCALYEEWAEAGYLSLAELKQRRLYELSAGFALMAYPNGALKDTNVRGFLYMKGATASVLANQLEQSAVDVITDLNEYVAIYRGHQPVNGMSIALQTKIDRYFAVVGIDITNYDQGAAATVGTIYQHEDGAVTLGVRLKNPEGNEYDMELATLDKNGNRLYPSVSNAYVKSMVYGEKIPRLNDEQFARFCEEQLAKGTANNKDQDYLKMQRILASPNKDTVIEKLKANFVVQYVVNSDKPDEEPRFQLLCEGKPITQDELGDATRTPLFLGLKTTVSQTELLQYRSINNSIETPNTETLNQFQIQSEHAMTEGTVYGEKIPALYDDQFQRFIQEQLGKDENHPDRKKIERIQGSHNSAALLAHLKSSFMVQHFIMRNSTDAQPRCQLACEGVFTGEQINDKQGPLVFNFKTTVSRQELMGYQNIYNLLPSNSNSNSNSNAYAYSYPSHNQGSRQVDLNAVAMMENKIIRLTDAGQYLVVGAQKKNLHDIFRQNVNTAQTIDQLQGLMQVATDPKLMKVLNAHSHPSWDKWTGKAVTNTWRDTLKLARERGIELLNKELQQLIAAKSGQSHSSSSSAFNSHSIHQDSEDQDSDQINLFIQRLSALRDAPLFKEHSKNHFIQGAWGNTSAQREIDSLISRAQGLQPKGQVLGANF